MLAILPKRYSFLLHKIFGYYPTFWLVILGNAYNELFKNINNGNIVYPSANMGACTMPAANLMGDNEKIISIEPHKSNS